jgi:hypothetical protein
MDVFAHRADCTRARQLAALQPDGSLSRVELALLERHLERCPSCRGFAETVTASTMAVRDSIPSPFRVDLSLITASGTSRRPPRRRVARWVRQPRIALGGVAGALALVATTVIALEVTRPEPAPPPGRLLIIQATDATRDLKREIATLKNRRPEPASSPVVTRHPGLQLD